MSSELKLKRLKEEAILPTKGSSAAAGWDLYTSSTTDEWVPPHQTMVFDTGWAMTVPAGTWGGIFARSGIATKQGLRPANCVGVIDHDYTGPVKVAIHNDLNDPQLIPHGSRIAQLLILPVVDVELTEVDELEETERADGGFGHSGIN